MQSRAPRSRLFLFALALSVAGCAGDCSCGAKKRASGPVSADALAKKAPKKPRVDRHVVSQSQAPAAKKVPISEAFATMLADMKACRAEKKSCAKANKRGQRLVQRAIQEAGKGDETGRATLSRLLIETLERTKHPDLRYWLAAYLAFLRTSPVLAAEERWGQRVLAQLIAEDRKLTAARLADALKAWLNPAHKGLMASLRRFLTARTGGASADGARELLMTALRQTTRKHPGLRSLVIAVFDASGSPPRLRRRAARSLASLQDPKERAAAARKLVKVLQTTQDRALAATSAEVLGEIGGSESLPHVLMQIRRRGNDPTFLASAATGLAKMVGREGIDARPLIQAARGILRRDGLSKVGYRNAIRVIRDSGLPESTKLLLALAKHPDQVRAKLAAKALTTLKRKK